MFKFRKSRNRNENENYIIKTNEDKIREDKMQEEKMRCPNCGKNPRGGSYKHGIVFGTTNGTYSYITCTHCNCDYKYIG